MSLHTFSDTTALSLFYAYKDTIFLPNFDSF